MKKEEKEVRKLSIKVRMNHEEMERIKKYQRRTTERSLSEYIRSVSMQEPVTVKYRNQSADDFLKEMLALKKELNFIGNNFNQAVHKLHMLDKIPEFREWVKNYDSLLRSLVQKSEEIRSRVIQLHEQWSQK